MQVSDSLLRKIVQMGDQPLKPAREESGIHGHAQHVAALKPVRGRLTLFVQGFQLLRTLVIKILHG